MSKNIITPYFRASYPNLSKPRRNDLSGKDEYSLVALFKKGEDLSALVRAVQECAEEKWGKDKSKWPKGGKIRSPFRDQAERVKDGELPPGHEAGAIFINLRSNRRPGLVDQNREDILNEEDFYGGCYARAAIRPYAYEVKGNAGVAFGLQHVQKVRDGEPFGNITKPQDEFGVIEVESPNGEDNAGGVSDLASMFG